MVNMDDPQDVAAHFYAQMLGIEITDEPAPRGTFVGDLEHLLELRDQGVISEGDFQMAFADLQKRHWPD